MSGDADVDVAIDSSDAWPADADSVDEGVLVNWFAREGTSVEAGETLCEIQIEKVSVDVPSPAAGTLARILVDENEEFARGDSLGVVRTE